MSPRVAWASGANGTVLRTVDGGVNWQAAPCPAPSTLDFRDVDAMSEHVAYVLSIGPGEASRIYKTTDGGEHWDLQFQDTDPSVSSTRWRSGTRTAASPSATPWTARCTS